VPSLATLLVSAGVLTVGVGYVCHALFAFCMFFCSRERLVDFERLKRAFSVTVVTEPKKRKGKRAQRRELESELLAEFHIRLHAHAPEGLLSHCTHRNTGWYIAKTSAMACLIGWLLAALVMCAKMGDPFHVWKDLCVQQQVGVGLSLLVFGAVFPVCAWYQGTKWNREFWAVGWKWITWDRLTHKLPDDWGKSLPKGVEYKP